MISHNQIFILKNMEAFGLINFTGAACWFNSMIQAFLSSKKLINIILTNEMRPPLIFELQLIITKKVDNLLTLSKFLQLPQQVSQQSDPSEFVDHFIEQLNNVYPIKPKFTHAITYHISCYCGQKHMKREIGTYLSVSKDNIRNLQRHLDGENEFIEYECEHQEANQTPSIGKRKVIRTAKLTRAPDLFIVHVKNYDEASGPMSSVYPKILSFDTFDDSKHIYNLTAVVEHHGSKTAESGGHYTCTGIRSTGIYNLDDSNSYKVGDFPSSTNIYLLFYELQ